jgi:hypothetical protein
MGRVVNKLVVERRFVVYFDVVLSGSFDKDSLTMFCLYTTDDNSLTLNCILK